MATHSVPTTSTDFLTLNASYLCPQGGPTFCDLVDVYASFDITLHKEKTERRDGKACVTAYDRQQRSDDESTSAWGKGEYVPMEEDKPTDDIKQFVWVIIPTKRNG